MNVDSGSEYIPSKDNLSFKDIDDDNNTSFSSGTEECIEEVKEIENPIIIEGKNILNRSNLSILPKDHSLKLNPDNISAFKELQESIMVQIVLLNRRRAGEVQRILLHTYINAPSEVSQEEISHALSPVELELTKSFKRIVIRGKRGRGVPILFTIHLQKRLTFLLKIRIC